MQLSQYPVGFAPAEDFFAGIQTIVSNIRIRSGLEAIESVQSEAESAALKDAAWP
jgi:hypothetical protein